MLNYVRTNRIAGTYEYINNDTGALYVGSADDIWARHLKHLYISDIDLALYNEGLENFTFKVLEEFPIGTDRSILRQNERKWIDYFDAENNPLHYNKPRTGGCSKYTIWDPSKVSYNKKDMLICNEKGLNPRKTFRVAMSFQGGCTLPIGGFYEPYTPAMIYDFVQKWA